MRESIRGLIERCEEMIRAGHGDGVRAAIQALNYRTLDMNMRLPIANLARRVSLIEDAQQILWPVLYGPMAKIHRRPIHREWAEYGLILTKLGATREAFEALHRARKLGAESSEVNLFMAWCALSIWDSAAALIHIQEYMNDPKLTLYQQCLGWVNQIAALVSARRTDEALAVIENWIAVAEKNDFRRLHANLLELLTQIHYERREYSQAEAVIGRALKVLAESDTADRLFIEKWRGAIVMARTGHEEILNEVQTKARRLRHWETLRSVDLIRFEHTRDPKLAARLYFGSPLPFFRDRIIEQIAGEFELPEVFSVGEGKSALDLATGQLDGKNIFGRSRHLPKLLALLCSDFYRPHRGITLFCGLFPGDQSDPAAASNRIYQLIHRVRDTLGKHKLPLTVYEHGGLFRGSLHAPGCRVIFHAQVEREDDFIPLLTLKRVFGADFFDPRSAQSELKISASTFKRMMKSALEQGRVEKFGQGRGTRYKLVG